MRLGSRWQLDMCEIDLETLDYLERMEEKEKLYIVYTHAHTHTHAQTSEFHYTSNFSLSSPGNEIVRERSGR